MASLDKQRFECPDAPASTGFRSQGLASGGFLFVSGMIGNDPNDHPDRGLAAHVDVALRHLDIVTTYAGGRRDDVVELSAFHVPANGAEVVNDRTAAFLGFTPELFNATRVFDVALHGLVELDWIVNLDSHRSAKEAAAIIAPLGHEATTGFQRSGPFLIQNRISAPGESLGEQSIALFDRITRELVEAGSSLEKIVKLTVFIRDFEPYPEFNSASKSAFASIIPPARSVVVAPEITGPSHIVIDILALA